MTDLKLRVVGCGDAFGTGGLHATCFYLSSEHDRCLIDIGSGSLPNLKAMGLNLREISCLVISHFHGDHFGGLPNFLLDAVFVQRRQQKLTIIGPKGVESKVWALQESMYGDTSHLDFGFPIDFIEFEPGRDIKLTSSLAIQSIPVIHSAPSHPHAVKITVNGKSIVYTGDTEWTDDLAELTRGSDVVICECFGWSGPLKYHLTYQEIISKMEVIAAERLFLTHLGPEAYSRMPEMKLPVLKPGMELRI